MIKDGTVKIELVDNIMKIANYISKTIDNSLLNKKCYFTSKNMNKLKKEQYLIENINDKKLYKQLNVKVKLYKQNKYDDFYTKDKIKYFLYIN